MAKKTHIQSKRKPHPLLTTNINLHGDVAEDLKRRAEEMGMSRAQLIRMILRDYCEKTP